MKALLSLLVFVTSTQAMANKQVDGMRLDYARREVYRLETICGGTRTVQETPFAIHQVSNGIEYDLEVIQFLEARVRELAALNCGRTVARPKPQTNHQTIRNIPGAQLALVIEAFGPRYTSIILAKDCKTQVSPESVQAPEVYCLISIKN